MDDMPQEHPNEDTYQKMKEELVRSVQDALAAQLHDVARLDDVAEVSGAIQVKIDLEKEALYAKLKEDLQVQAHHPSAQTFTPEDMKSALGESLLQFRHSFMTEGSGLLRSTVQETVNESFVSLKREIQAETKATMQEMVNKGVAVLKQEIQDAGTEVREGVQNSVDNTELKDAIKKLRGYFLQLLIGVSIALSAMFFGALAFWRI
jgi:hypothetical protein